MIRPPRVNTLKSYCSKQAQQRIFIRYCGYIAKNAVVVGNAVTAVEQRQNHLQSRHNRSSYDLRLLKTWWSQLSIDIIFLANRHMQVYFHGMLSWHYTTDPDTNQIEFWHHDLTWASLRMSRFIGVRGWVNIFVSLCRLWYQSSISYRSLSFFQKQDNFFID